ncbi:MAG: hypothetical protein RI996_390 [Candidatus Parcubacteria bacterium]|jgi:hypothetical protein
MNFENIIKSISPWVKIDLEKKQEDRLLLDEIISILSPTIVKSFTDSLLKANYDRNYNSIISEYINFSQLVTTKFHRTKIQNKYLKLTASLEELNVFLTLNFSSNYARKEIMLLDKNDDDHTVYDKNLIELERLVIDFKKNMTNL